MKKYSCNTHFRNSIKRIVISSHLRRRENLLSVMFLSNVSSSVVQMVKKEYIASLSNIKTSISFRFNLNLNLQITFVVSIHLTLDCGAQKYFFACFNVGRIDLTILYSNDLKTEEFEEIHFIHCYIVNRSFRTF